MNFPRMIIAPFQWGNKCSHFSGHLEKLAVINGHKKLPPSHGKLLQTMACVVTDLSDSRSTVPYTVFKSLQVNLYRHSSVYRRYIWAHNLLP